MSKEQARISDASGLTFVITETNCDSFGNSTVTTIDAYDRGNSKTMLLKYGPDERSGMPRIVVQDSKIEIQIDSVVEIMRQETSYKAYEVRYKIGRVEYPHN